MVMWWLFSGVVSWQGCVLPVPDVLLLADGEHGSFGDRVLTNTGCRSLLGPDGALSAIWSNLDCLCLCDWNGYGRFAFAEVVTLVAVFRSDRPHAGIR